MYCDGEENLKLKDRLVAMKVKFEEKAKNGNDALNTIKVHAKVGVVVIQVDHKGHGLHHILVELNPGKVFATNNVAKYFNI